MGEIPPIHPGPPPVMPIRKIKQRMASMKEMEKMSQPESINRFADQSLMKRKRYLKQKLSAKR